MWPRSRLDGSSRTSSLCSSPTRRCSIDPTCKRQWRLLIPVTVKSGPSSMPGLKPIIDSIERTTIPLRRDSLQHPRCARARPLVIQSLFFRSTDRDRAIRKSKPIACGSVRFWEPAEDRSPGCNSTRWPEHLPWLRRSHFLERRTGTDRRIRSPPHRSIMLIFSTRPESCSAPVRFTREAGGDIILGKKLTISSMI